MPQMRFFRYNRNMKTIPAYLKKKPLSILLIALPIAVIGAFLEWNALVLFSLSALSVVPLAGLIGDGTEGLAAFTGPKLGGLINATLGNAKGFHYRLDHWQFVVRFGIIDPRGRA